MWKKSIILAIGFAAIVSAQDTAEQIPRQARRGLDLFGQRKCSSCHKLGDNGTAIAPDLTAIARISPRGIRIMILSTRTEHVVAVQLKSAEVMPGLRVSDDGKTLQVYDLSKDPPVLREIEKSHVASIRDNVEWKHPPASTELDGNQLADLIAYIRWAAYRDKKGVDPAEVQ